MNSNSDSSATPSVGQTFLSAQRRGAGAFLPPEQTPTPRDLGLIQTTTSDLVGVG